MRPEWTRTLSPVAMPRPDDASETAWCLAASPNQSDTIECAYLAGQQVDHIEMCKDVEAFAF